MQGRWFSHDIAAAVGKAEQVTDQRTRFTAFASLLQRCGNSKNLRDGKLLHHHLKAHNHDADTYLANWLIKMYGDCGSMGDATSVFHNLPSANVFTWNILIKAFCKNGRCKEALKHFNGMLTRGIRPTHVSFVAALNACAGMASLNASTDMAVLNQGNKIHGEVIKLGKQIHGEVIKLGFERHLVVGTALVNLYGKCAVLEDAKRVFRQMPKRDVVAWSAMMAACAQNGHAEETLELYHQMQQDGIKPNQFTFVSALDACASLGALEEGHTIHASILRCGYQRQAIVGTALVHMYGKCRRLVEARRVFEQMPQRDLVSWGAMISAYAQNDHGRDALDLFSRMQCDGFKPNHITFASALDACASLAALEKGQELHAAIVEVGFEGEIGIGNALVDMYGKCGNLEDAKTVFSQMPRRDLVSWNSIIAACAQNGNTKEALSLFNRMRFDGVKPDHITFLSILIACRHAGKFNEAMNYFVSMNKDHGVKQTLEHYMCLIDTFGRAGRLDDAEHLIDSMPFDYKARYACACQGA